MSETKPKCQKCMDTGWTNGGQHACGCEIGFAKITDGFQIGNLAVIRSRDARLRARIAALEAAAPGPDGAQVLADIRAAMPEGFKAVGFRGPKDGELTIVDPGEFCALGEDTICELIIAPIVREPQNCPMCGAKAETSRGNGSLELTAKCSRPAEDCAMAQHWFPADLWNRLTLAPKRAGGT